VRYDLRHPVAYAEMTLHKIEIMWLHPSRLGNVAKPGWIAVVHLLVLGLGLAGLLAGILRARSLALWILVAALAYGTALHALLVSQARYNLPLMPLLIAAGVAGAALARHGDPPPATPATAVG
jgi:hypothetical protein